MSFRILNQAPQYLLPDGRVNAGGRLHFYETDLSTPKDTWSDEDLNTLNSNPVIMDAAGRTATDVWGDGEYGVVMTDAAGVTIWTRNNVRADVGAGAEIPALVSGQFLTNDGSVLQWQPIRQVPDPSGSNGYILSTDGELAFWIPPPEVPEPPEPPEPDIVVEETSGSLNSFQAGISTDPDKFFLQAGSGSAPASGTNNTTASISFPVGFAASPVILITPRTATSGGGFMPIPGIISKSPNDFTVKFESNAGNVSSGRIINSVPFDWIAIGIREVT